MDQDLKSKVQAEVKKARGVAGRALLLAWLYVRGVPHERAERRVSEHNMPSPRAVQVAIETIREGKAPAEPWSVHVSPDLMAWLTIPEERIRRYGPKVKKERARRAEGGASLPCHES